jgi:hypothetical protein
VEIEALSLLVSPMAHGTNRVEEVHRLLSLVRAQGPPDGQQMGIPVGQAGVGIDAVRHGPDRRVDCRCPRLSQAPRCPHLQGSGGDGGRCFTRGVRLEAFDGFDPGASDIGVRYT